MVCKMDCKMVCKTGSAKWAAGRAAEPSVTWPARRSMETAKRSVKWPQAVRKIARKTRIEAVCEAFHMARKLAGAEAT